MTLKAIFPHHFSRKDLFFLLALFLISLSARSPLLFTENTNDYDDPVGLLSPIENAYIYGPMNHPGAPVWEMLTIVSYHKIVAPLERRLGSKPSAVVIYKFISFCCGFLVLLLFYYQLRSRLDAITTFMIALTLSLHPVMMWMSSAWSQDIVAVAIGYYAFHLSRTRRPWWGSAILAAIAIGMRFTTGVFALGAALNYALEPKSSDGLETCTRFLKYVLLVIGLTILFFLPAYMHYHMDLTRQFSSPMYGTTFVQRIQTGVLLFRHVVLYWLPLFLYFLVIYVKRWRGGIRTWENPWDPALLVFILFCMIEYKNISFFWILFFALSAYLGVKTLTLAWKEQKLFNTADAGDIAVVLMTFVVVCMAPFSRNYFLPLLPSLTYLLAKRVSSRRFWILTALVSYLPMLYYFAFNFAKPQLAIYKEGFYGWFYDDPPSWNEINDFGFKSHTPQWIIGRKSSSTPS